MSKELLCKVNYKYSEDGLPEVIKRFVESEFMKTRNEAIKHLNPHYEEWNEAYNKKVSGADDKEYNAYIRDKQNEVLDMFNKMWFGPVKLYADDDTDIAGRFKVFGKTITMHMGIELI